MRTLVSRARRRLFHNELFSQGALAAVAILIALILLLLLGTQILDWRLMLLVSTLAVAAALYRARRRLPAPYAAAQVVDRRLGLADTISTAVYFQEEPGARVSAPVRQCQLARANRAAQSADVRRAVPYAIPRGVYPMAALALVAGSLFGLRYGLLGHLDLRPPLAHVLEQQFGWKERSEVARSARRQPPQVPNQPDDAAASVNDPEQTQSMQPDSSANDGSDASSDNAAEKGDSTKSGDKKDGNRTGKASADGDQEAQAESNPSQPAAKSGDPAGKQEPKQQSGGKPESNNSGENSSLMSKAKDLLQNLLSSLKPPAGNPGSQQQNNDPNQGKGQPKQQNDKNGQPQNGGQKGDQSEGQQGEQAQDQQDQSQQGNGKNDSRQANRQPGSGAGNQDGDKRIKQAADLAAMGKITEILGKRSANLTGEATVEVQSTSQQLKTAYAPGAAQHGQSGGEIDRDEIPVAIEPFVQEYFKQARKQDPAPPAPAAKKQ